VEAIESRGIDGLKNLKWRCNNLVGWLSACEFMSSSSTQARWGSSSRESDSFVVCVNNLCCTISYVLLIHVISSSRMVEKFVGSYAKEEVYFNERTEVSRLCLCGTRHGHSLIIDTKVYEGQTSKIKVRSTSQLNDESSSRSTSSYLIEPRP
jgi:hypothetical protein